MHRCKYNQNNCRTGFSCKDNVTMLNNNQSGNTNHSLVILHATLNVCGKSGADFGRQLFSYFAVSFFFIFPFFVFILFSLVFRRPTQSDEELQRHSFASSNNNGIKLNENYTTFCCSCIGALENLSECLPALKISQAKGSRVMRRRAAREACQKMNNTVADTEPS